MLLNVVVGIIVFDLSCYRNDRGVDHSTFRCTKFKIRKRKKNWIFRKFLDFFRFFQDFWIFWTFFGLFCQFFRIFFLFHGFWIFFRPNFLDFLDFFWIFWIFFGFFLGCTKTFLSGQPLGNFLFVKTNSSFYQY